MTWLHGLAGLAVLLSGLAYPWAARADSPLLPPPPVIPVVDANGVNILTGAVQYHGPIVSIGPVGQGGLSYDYFGNSQTGSPWISTVKFLGSNNTYSVTVLGSNEVFNQNTDGTFSPYFDSGGSLTHSGSTYTYTSAEGTRVLFNDVNYCDPNHIVCTFGLASTLTYASGETLTFTMRTTNLFFGIQSINSNLGYQIKVHYQCDTPGSICYINVSQIIAINNAVDYCDPSANSCTGLTQSWPTLNVTYSTSPSGGTTSVTDAVGNTTNMVGSSDPVTHDPIASLQRPSGRHIDYQTSLCVTCDPGISIMTATDGAQWGYTIFDDPSHQRITGTAGSPPGVIREVTAEHDFGRPTSDVVDRDGLHLETDYGYGGPFYPTKITYPEGNYTQVTSDSRGNVTQLRKVAKPGSVSPDIVSSATYVSSCTSTNFRWCNKPLTVTDANGNTTTYTYSDDHGGVLTETGPAVGGVQPQTRYTYEQRYAWYKTSAGGPIWGSAVWNSFNWTVGYSQAATPVWVLTRVSRCMSGSSCTGTAQESLTVNSYVPGDSANFTNLRLASVSQQDGSGTLVSTTSSTYDIYGNVVTKTDPKGNTSAYFYDLNRNQTGAIGPDPDGAGSLKNPAVKTTYDVDGRVAEIEQGTTTSQSSMSSFASLTQKTTTYQNTYFAPVSLETSFVGGLSNPVSATQYSYNDARKLQCTAVREDMTVLSSLPDACTHTTAGTYGPDQITRNSYDGAYRLVTVQRGYDTPSVITEVTKAYTPNSNIDYLEDANGNRTAYTYDGHDRLTQLNFPSKTAPHTPSASDLEQYDYDANGNRTALRLRSGEIVTYTYDALNRQTSKQYSTSGATPVYSGYDLLGNLLYAHNSSPSGAGIDYTWDALGRKTSETQYGRAVSSQYDANGNRTRLTWPDGNYVQYTYDALNRMLQVQENGSTVRATYSYDDLSRTTGIARPNSTATAMSYSATSLGWNLTQDMSGTSQDVTYGLTFTPAPQVYQRSINNTAYGYSAPALTKSYVVNGLNQYNSAGNFAFSYDARGNLTSDGSRSFAYDLENRLTTVSGSAAMSLAYDPRGRMQQTIASSTQEYLYDGDSLIAEYSSSGSILRRYVPGRGVDETLVWYEGSNLSAPNWLHTDQQGSTVAVSNSSGAATVYAYSPSGEPAGGWGSSAAVPIFRYTGQAALPQVGLYYYKARMYDPAQGRFLQTDPVGYTDDYNLYTYVGNDPANKTDPSGNCIEDGCIVEFTAIGAGIGAVVGGATYAISAGDNFSTKGLLSAAGSGAVTGAAIGFSASAGGLATGVAGGLAGAAARGAVFGAAGSALGDIASGNQIDAKKAAVSGVAGALGGVAGGAAIGRIAAKSDNFFLVLGGKQVLGGIAAGTAASVGVRTGVKTDAIPAMKNIEKLAVPPPAPPAPPPPIPLGCANPSSARFCGPS